MDSAVCEGGSKLESCMLAMMTMILNMKVKPHILPHICGSMMMNRRQNISWQVRVGKNRKAVSGEGSGVCVHVQACRTCL